MVNGLTGAPPLNESLPNHVPTILECTLESGILCFLLLSWAWGAGPVFPALEGKLLWLPGYKGVVDQSGVVLRYGSQGIA